MILGRGTKNGNDLLIIGLSALNIRRLLQGDPILIRRLIHGDAVPEGWEILILAGATEDKIKKDLLKAGMIDDLTTVIRTTKLGRKDDT